MLARRLVPHVALIMMVATLAGCPAKRARSDPGGLSAQVLVYVENNLNPPSPITVRLVSDDGGVRILGSVSPASRQVLRFRPISSSARFRLFAEIPNERGLLSPIFVLSNVGSVQWDLRSNLVTFADRE